MIRVMHVDHVGVTAQPDQLLQQLRRSEHRDGDAPGALQAVPGRYPDHPVAALVDTRLPRLPVRAARLGLALAGQHGDLMTKCGQGSGLLRDDDLHPAEMRWRISRNDQNAQRRNREYRAVLHTTPGLFPHGWGLQEMVTAIPAPPRVTVA